MPLPDKVVVGISAEDLTSPAFQSAQARMVAFQSTLNTTTGSFKEARAASAVLNEEIGLKMSRHLQSTIASSQLLQGVLSKAFPVIAAIGFAEVLSRVPEMMQNAFNSLSGLDAENAMIEANSKLAESLHKIAEQTAAAAAAYERLGKSAGLVAVMDKADAASKQISAQLQLSNLKSLLIAQEALALHTERTGGGGSFRGGTPASSQPTAEARQALSMIPALKDQIAQLTNGMTLLGINSATAGKKMDESLTAAFDKAGAAADAAQKKLVAWDHMWNKLRTNSEFLTAPGQGLLDKAQIPGGPINAPDWMAGLSKVQSPLYAGNAATMGLAKIQT